MKMEQSVPKRRHIKFRRRGITQKKAYKNSLPISLAKIPLIWTHNVWRGNLVTQIYNFLYKRVSLLINQINFSTLLAMPTCLSRVYPLVTTYRQIALCCTTGNISDLGMTVGKFPHPNILHTNDIQTGRKISPPPDLGSYRAVNTFCLENKQRPVNVVFWNNTCLFRDLYKNINSLWCHDVEIFNFIAGVGKIAVGL